MNRLLPTLFDVLDSSAVGLFLLDADCRIVWLNETVACYFGLSRAEVLGANKAALVRTRLKYRVADPAAFAEKILATYSDNTYIECFECHVLPGPDQAERWLEHWSQPIRSGPYAGGRVEYYTDITALKQAQANLHHWAYHDSLTGLPNRRRFDERLREALASMQATGAEVAVLFLDLDGFKSVNDRYGHTVGDALLHAAAGRLRSCLREADCLARVGGDEFLGLLTGAPVTRTAARAARRLLASMGQPLTVAGRRISLGLSIGISRAPVDSQDDHTLIHQADTALYRAKADGGHRYRFHTTALTAAARRRRQVAEAVQRAVLHGDFTVAYQPLVALPSGQVVGAEALVRCRRPGGESIEPKRFITMAKETELIGPLGAWVLRTACQQAAAWRAAGCPVERIAVNVAGSQLRDSHFPATVQAILTETGLAPEALELEVAETAWTLAPETVQTGIEALRALGVGLAADDFGTGGTALARLKQSPCEHIHP